jgi:hypothetical protein
MMGGAAPHALKFETHQTCEQHPRLLQGGADMHLQADS